MRGRCVSPTTKNNARRHCRRQIELTVSYTLSRPASVTFTLKRKAPGRKANGKCVKPTQKNKHNKRCTRLVSIHGKLVKAGEAGANRFVWDGKIAGHELAPGSYQLIATPTGGKPETLAFGIVQ
jgi:hypothetical protein